MESDRGETPAPLVGTVLGRYRLERMLGEGGMGTVYAARHQDLGKLAAVKILHERYESSEEVQVRFMREGQAVSRIRHPNIVDVYDVGTEAGRAYLVMELLEGEDLRSLLTREGALSPQQAADVMVPVVSALAAAHDLGVVHRDLKPDNIFLCAERNSMRPKVLDFGISKVVGSKTSPSLTGSGTLLGTPYYMSPEQAKTEKSIDSRSDQYSLGVILFECVTGRRPVEDAALYHVMQRIVRGDFPSPRQLEPTLPSSFEQVIQRAMARVAADRFPTTRALGRALLPFASERVRANYAEELAQDQQQSAPKPLRRATNQVGGLDTTLGKSAHESESSRPVRRRFRVLPVALASLLLVLVGIIVWKFLALAPPTSSGSTNGGLTAAARAPAEAPPPTEASAPALASAPTPTLSAASPLPASAAPLASAKPSTGPSKPRNAAVAPKPLPKRATPTPDPPELAPR